MINESLPPMLISLFVNTNDEFISRDFYQCLLQEPRRYNSFTHIGFSTLKCKRMRRVAPKANRLISSGEGAAVNSSELGSAGPESLEEVGAVLSSSLRSLRTLGLPPRGATGQRSRPACDYTLTRLQRGHAALYSTCPSFKDVCPPARRA